MEFTGSRVASLEFEHDSITLEAQDLVVLATTASDGRATWSASALSRTMSSSVAAALMVASGHSFVPGNSAKGSGMTSPRG